MTPEFAAGQPRLTAAPHLRSPTTREGQIEIALSNSGDNHHPPALGHVLARNPPQSAQNHHRPVRRRQPKDAPPDGASLSLDDTRRVLQPSLKLYFCQLRVL
ncbi:hypothetical protein RchiOBHm_Chr7g0204731 [Rosa chinensis]|uniref:Uncharacterized protein n=1 Tax=Rosa chinensis TaxID=74649 RepID=A0A2P6P8S0_ROSCH|nr:hypothetical protein RchiOBHm_Chr7g0204731 [Rosa chinensis]